MSDELDDRESPLLAAAIEEERAREILPPEVHGRLRARVLACVASGTGGGAMNDGAPESPAPPDVTGPPSVPLAPAAGLTIKVWSALAIGTVIGAVAGSLATRAMLDERAPAPQVESPRPVSAGAEPPPAPPPVDPQAPSIRDPEPAPAEADAPPPDEPRSRPRPARPPSAADLEEERTLIELARAAHARGNDDAAMDALARHARRFPDGALTEERDGLRVIALAATDPARARAEAARFRRRYPASVLLPAIERALRESAHPEAAPE